ncbi:MAG: AAA family ATPase [Acidimicrobiales bacterium]
MRLVGRDRHLAELSHVLERAVDGSGAVVVVTGPRGAGKTALIDAVVARGRPMGFEVVRVSPLAGQPPRLVWAQLLRDAGASDELAARVLHDPAPFDLDSAARHLALGDHRLLVVEDVDNGGSEAIEMLALMAARVASGSTAVIASATRSLGIGRELLVGGLDEAEFAVLVPELEAPIARALWAACRGLPGVGLSLAAAIDTADGDDAIALAALRAPPGVGFLDLDVGLIRLLEEAAAVACDDGVKARVMARLARELLGDASAGLRRRALADDALVLARRSGDRVALADVLDARLHALWDPAGAEDRLAAASEIIALARAVGDDGLERRGLFWRFIALMELGRVGEAESTLAAFAAQAAEAGDAEATVMVTARYAMLATMRGRFDEAGQMIAEVARSGGRLGMADTDRLVATLRGAIMFQRGRSSELAAEAVEALSSFARRNPGNLYEATAARILATVGREQEAAAELARLLPRALVGSGPRWLGAIAELATVAAAVGDAPAAAALYNVLTPYRGRLVVWGGANTTAGPVSHFLGLLGTALGLLDAAIQDFEDAVALDEAVGALPLLAHSLMGLAAALDLRGRAEDHTAAGAHRQRAGTIAERLGMNALTGPPPGTADEWRLERDGLDWVLEAAGERVRLHDSRGLHYLRALLAAPRHDIAALDLVADGGGLIAPGVDPQLDDQGREAYRRRIAALDAMLDAADRAGDPERASRAEAERAALVVELRRATGLGGRDRGTNAEAERARVNVTRTLRGALARIAEAAPAVAAHLEASLRTGRACRYDPAPGGPARWRV